MDLPPRAGRRGPSSRAGGAGFGRRHMASIVASPPPGTRRKAACRRAAPVPRPADEPDCRQGHAAVRPAAGMRTGVGGGGRRPRQGAQLAGDSMRRHDGIASAPPSPRPRARCDPVRRRRGQRPQPLDAPRSPCCLWDRRRQELRPALRAIQPYPVLGIPARADTWQAWCSQTYRFLPIKAKKTIYCF